MSRSGLQQYRTQSQSKRNKPSWNGSRNGKPTTRELEGDLLNTVRQFGSDVSRSVRQCATGLRNGAAQYLKQGRKRARSLEKSVERRIEQRPLSTLMAAAGVGVLIGVLAARRR